MTGMFVGIGVVFLGIVVFSVLASIGGGDIASVPLIAIVFVPSLVFVPIGACMMLFTLLLKKSDPLAGSDSGYVDGIYCPRCMYDLRGSLESTACPECGKVIDQDKLARGVDYGIGIAWRSTWLSVSLSTLISGVGYLIMVGIWLVTEYM